VAVPLPDEDSVRAVVGDGYDPATTLNVVRMFAGTEEFYPALIGMVKAVFGTPDIDARHREVIILRAAAVLNAPYEWQANEQMARNAGLTAAEVDAIACDGPVTGIDPEFALLTTATDEMLTTGTLTDPTLQALLDAFGAVVTRKYIATISWFSLLSLFLNATRVPLETTDKIGDRVSPLG
jgi:alkylhydroperoxidase family enzyme